MEAQTIMQPADETNLTQHLPRRHKTWQRLRHLVPVSLALALILSLGSVEAWAKTNVNDPLETSAPAQVGPTSQGAASAKGSDYAAREARTPGLENFQGGDLVIIGSGGLVLVLLIIVLILLV